MKQMINLKIYLSNALNDAYKSGKLGTYLITNIALLSSVFIFYYGKDTMEDLTTTRGPVLGAAIYTANLVLLHALPMIINRQSLFFKPCAALIIGTLGTLGTTICTLYLINNIALKDKDIIKLVPIANFVAQANTVLFY